MRWERCFSSSDMAHNQESGQTQSHLVNDTEAANNVLQKLCKLFTEVSANAASIHIIWEKFCSLQLEKILSCQVSAGSAVSGTIPWVRRDYASVDTILTNVHSPLNTGHQDKTRTRYRSDTIYKDFLTLCGTCPDQLPQTSKWAKSGGSFCPAPLPNTCRW